MCVCVCVINMQRNNNYVIVVCLWERLNIVEYLRLQLCRRYINLSLCICLYNSSGVPTRQSIHGYLDCQAKSNFIFILNNPLIISLLEILKGEPPLISSQRRSVSLVLIHLCSLKRSLCQIKFFLYSLGYFRKFLEKSMYVSNLSDLPNFLAPKLRPLKS